MVVWAGLSNSQSIGYSYTTISKRLKITTLKGIEKIEKVEIFLVFPNPMGILNQKNL